jgi:hypothetical protein
MKKINQFSNVQSGAGGTKPHRATPRQRTGNDSTVQRPFPGQWLPFWAPFDAVFDTSCTA